MSNNYLNALITFVTISIYIALTFTITQWRIQFRKDMNAADNDASTKMIDSLLNFETVKYFNNEDHEFNRLDNSLSKYEIAANKNRMSLSLLNVSQTLVIMTGITGRLYELRKAAEACYDYAVHYNTPFISGKDSMYNDFKGFNQKNNPIKISIPPTDLVAFTFGILVFLTLKKFSYWLLSSSL